MSSALLTVEIILAIILTIIVLLQKSSSIGLGAYSGSNDSVFGAKGPDNFLSKFTFFIGFLFVANTITLGYLFNQEKSVSVLDEIAEPVKPKNVVPSAPVAEEITPETKEATTNTVPAIPEVPVMPTAPTGLTDSMSNNILGAIAEETVKKDEEELQTDGEYYDASIDENIEVSENGEKVVEVKEEPVVESSEETTVETEAEEKQ